MKVKGLKGRVLTHDQFRAKMRLNEGIETDIAYHIYILTKTSNKSLGISSGSVLSVVLTDISQQRILTNELLAFSIRKLLKHKIITRVEKNPSSLKLYHEKKVVAFLLFTSKDNCVAHCLGTTITRYFYFDTNLTPSQKHMREVMAGRIRARFSDYHPYLAW